MVIAVLLAGIIGGGGVHAAGPSILLPDSDQTGSLTIHKFRVEDYANLQEGTGSSTDSDNLSDDAEKLSNVQFKIEKLLLAADEEPTLSSTIDTKFTTITKATDGNGEIVFSDLEKGFYIVTEVLPEGYSAESEKFLVKIPTDGEGATVKDSNWNYDVHVYPKNMGSENSVTKVVAGERVVHGLYDEITWDVSYFIGTGLKKDVASSGSTSTVYAKDFYLYDVMDSRLDFINGSTTMEVFDIYQQKLSGISLIEGTDYTETNDENTHTVTWFFTDAGVQKIADNGVVYIDISITTKVNESALGTAADAVWNNARISFTNASGDPYVMEVFDSNGGKNGINVPKVWLGNISIEKVDAESDEKLAGAVFKIAESIADVNAGSFMQRDGEDIEVVTDGYGKAEIDIIGEGTYYLLETRAPKGFERLSAPIEVVIENSEEGRLVEVQVKNTATDDDPVTPSETGKPSTGGTVSTGDIVRIAGILLMLAGAAGTIIVVTSKNRRKRSI